MSAVAGGSLRESCRPGSASLARIFGDRARQDVTVPLAFRYVNAFHVIGGLLACWALLVSFLGVTRENFPATKGTERIVATISVVLVVAAISAAIITSATEEEEDDEGGGEAAALVLPG